MIHLNDIFDLLVFTDELKQTVEYVCPLSLVRFFKILLVHNTYLKSFFSLNNSSNKFFMLFLLTDNESLKLSLLIISTS